MSAVEILAAGAQADSGAGAAVDVSAFAVLRLDWSVLADLGRNPQLDITIDTGPTSSGPWTVAWTRRLDDRSWDVAPRATLGGFDSYVRARWAGHPRAPTPRTDHTMALTIGLAGVGKPDSA